MYRFLLVHALDDCAELCVHWSINCECSISSGGKSYVILIHKNLSLILIHYAILVHSIRNANALEF